MGGLRFHDEAAAELRESVRFYEEQSPGLGRGFLGEFEAFLAKIQADPTRFAIRVDEIRRVNLKRFPFHINYLIETNNAVHILAIAHNRRRPFYWKHRVPKE